MIEEIGTGCGYFGGHAAHTHDFVLAANGKLNSHFTALWDHGHIKFWSVKTLAELFAEQDLRCEMVLRVGRFPALAKSMILVFRK